MECVAKEEDETAGRGYCSTNSNGTKPKGAGERVVRERRATEKGGWQ